MNKPIDYKKAVKMLLKNYPSTRAAALATGLSGPYLSRISRGINVPEEMRFEKQQKLYKGLTAEQIADLEGSSIPIENNITLRLVKWIENLPNDQKKALVTLCKGLGFDG
jgi:hypothetical protein